MTHDEHCACGCDCGHDHHPPKPPVDPRQLTLAQQDFLDRLAHHHYLPVARFTLKDSREADFASTALAPVFLQSAQDDMATVRQMGASLQQLEDLGLLTLDYDIPLGSYDYALYRESALYAYFCSTVAEGAQNPDFLGDTPLMELGSIAPTDEGARIAAALCGHRDGSAT